MNLVKPKLFVQCLLFFIFVCVDVGQLLYAQTYVGKVIKFTDGDSIKNSLPR